MVNVCGNKRIHFLIFVVPLTPSLTAIGKEVRVRVSWNVVVVDWNLQTRIRRNALFVSP